MATASNAEEHLRVIRSMMERATTYRSVAGPAALLGGLLSIAVGIWSSFSGWNDCVTCVLIVWAIVLGITGLSNTAVLYRDDRQRGQPFFTPRLFWAFRASAPALVLAALATWPVASASLGAVGLLWSGGYALALLAMGHFAPRGLRNLGRAFYTATVVGMLFWLPPWQHGISAGRFLGLYMAVTFGLFHVVYAVCSWPRAGTDPHPSPEADLGHV